MRRSAAGLIVLALLSAGPVLAAPKTIHSERSLYRNLYVTEDDGLRCLTFRRSHGGERQTCVNLSQPKQLVFSYTKMMLGALYLNPAPQRILIIGMGGGTLPMTLRGLLPGAHIDVVEIDPAVVKVARKYFSFQDDPEMGVYEEDGRIFVKKQIKREGRYDLIMLDAFEDDYIPEHLLTREFLLEAKSLLLPGGVMAANTFSSSKLFPHESATYAAVFGTFYSLKLSNRVIWAQNGTLAELETIRANAATVEPALEPLGVKSDWLMMMVSSKRDWPENARVLTDQYSPSNILNAR